MYESDMERMDVNIQSAWMPEGYILVWGEEEIDEDGKVIGDGQEKSGLEKVWFEGKGL